MTDWYILDGRMPVRAASFDKWARWSATGTRRVALESIGEATVSTVFLGLDHGFGRGAPVLFETMIAGVSSDASWDHQTRYSTYQEAEEGHALAVEWVRSVVALAETSASDAITKAATPRDEP